MTRSLPVCLAAVFLDIVAMPAGAAEAAAALPAEASSWGLLAAALAVGMSSLGAGIAVAKLGAAAVGGLAEKPELLGRLLVFMVWPKASRSTG